MKIKVKSHWDHWRSHVIILGWEHYWQNVTKNGYTIPDEIGSEITILNFGFIFYKKVADKIVGRTPVEYMENWQKANGIGESGVIVKKQRVSGSIRV